MRSGLSRATDTISWRDLGGPAQRRHAWCARRCGAAGAAGVELAALGVAAAARRRRRSGAAAPAIMRHQEAARVGLEDAHGLHRRRPASSAPTFTLYGGPRLPLLEPGAGLADADAALVAGLEQLRGAVGGRRHVVADGEGQHREDQAQHQQRAQRAPRARGRWCAGWCIPSSAPAAPSRRWCRSAPRSAAARTGGWGSAASRTAAPACSR